jgi:septal ring factor EnvC (AmiA/AmiB activator)
MLYQLKNTRIAPILVMIGLLLSVNADVARAVDGHATGIVTADEVRVQSEPGRHGLPQKTLKQGSRFKIIKHRQGWIQILHNGEVGFIKDLDQTIKIIQRQKTGSDPKASKMQPGQRQQLDEYEKRKQNINREIKQGQQEVEVFARQESDTIKRLNQVERALNKSKKRTVVIRKELKKLESATREASQSSDTLIRQIRANEKYVAQRLVALYKMSWLGKFHLLASAESMHEFIQRRAALEHILAHDEKIRQDLISDQNALKVVLDRLNGLKDKQSSRAAALKQQYRQMSLERSTRTKLLADIRSQKALELAAIDALTQSSNELDRKINLLNTRINTPVKDVNPSQLPFSSHKGLLIRPVNGRIISLYGSYKNPKYNITNFRSGIEIKADSGEPVRSVYAGKVLYSSWFNTYGNMIIIDHGKNYYTVYAHLEEIFKAKGDDVEAGEVIATVGDTGSLTGAKLYFEVRHHGKPVNPMPWFKKG